MRLHILDFGFENLDFRIENFDFKKLYDQGDERASGPLREYFGNDQGIVLGYYYRISFWILIGF